MKLFTVKTNCIELLETVCKLAKKYGYITDNSIKPHHCFIYFFSKNEHFYFYTSNVEHTVCYNLVLYAETQFDKIINKFEKIKREKDSYKTAVPFNKNDMENKNDS